jgi:hypothetical protein
MTDTAPESPVPDLKENQLMTTTTKKRVRRTADQIIADLETKIAQVKARAAAKEAKAAPEGKASFAAVKALDKAIEVAGENGNDELVRALGAARAPMSEQMIKMGLRMPGRRATRSKRQKGDAT